MDEKAAGTQVGGLPEPAERPAEGRAGASARHWAGPGCEGHCEARSGEAGPWAERHRGLLVTSGPLL